MKKHLLALLLLLSVPAVASVTLPYTYTSGATIKASEGNANEGALRDEINAHEGITNAHNTTLINVLGLGNSTGSYNLDLNLNQLLNSRSENLGADPTCNAGSKGRLFTNTVSNLLKFCDGTNNITIAGTGVNNLSSVLSAGNSAGSTNINMNENQLLAARVENLGSDPSPGNAGRIWINTGSSTLKFDTGSAVQSIGGAQGLSSVLGVSNSAGSTNINFNANQALNMILDTLSSDPGTTVAGRIYYNSISKIPKFYNGTSWNSVGNTNTLAQTAVLGNSMGSTDLNFNSRQAQNMVLHNSAGSLGTGTAGKIWYDTVAGEIAYETSGANHYIATLDGSETLTNKGISGSTNTITNVPDSALSSNVPLKNASASITGDYTFDPSHAPTSTYLKSPSGGKHTIPNGLADDTFTLNNASQTLVGKTLQSPTLSGNIDFAEYQGVHERAENLAANPAAGNPGRFFYKTTTGELLYEDGTNWKVLTSNTNNYLAGLSGDVTATGPGIGAATVVSVGGSSDANIHAAELLANAATSANTANAIAKRSAGGDIASTSFTGHLIGTADSVTTNANLTGPITSVGNATSVASQTGTGSTFVMQASPTLTTPNLGTPSAVVLTNATGTAPSLTVGNATNATSATSATNATNATNTAITDDTTTNATMYPTWVTANTGNLPQKVSSSKLSFNPSTGTLTTSTVAAALTGTASGNTTYTANQYGVVLSGPGNAMTVLAPDASTTKVLTSGGVGANPIWAAAGTASPLTTKGDVYVYSTTNDRLPVGTDGQVLSADSTQATGLKWVAGGGGSGVTTMGAFGSSPNANGATISGATLTLQPANASNPGSVSTAAQTFAGTKTLSSNPTFSAMGTGIVHSSSGGATTSSLIVNADVTSVDASKITTGTLVTGRGGTGVNTITVIPAPSAFAGWDASSNMSANSFIAGYATTATSAGTTTLTVADSQQQYFTGSTTHTVKMPVTSTLAAGQQYFITNNSSGVVTVQSSGANTIQAMAANTQLDLTVISNAGTGTGSWSWNYYPQIPASSGVTTMAAVGSSPNSNGASISGSTLTLQPADGTNPGVATTAAQTFAGTKTFSSNPTFSAMTTAGIVHNAVTTGALTSSLIVDADISTVGASKITTGTLTLARGGTNADLSATGGANQVLQQSSSGAAITVGQLGFSNLSGTATDGQLATSYLKADGSRNLTGAEISTAAGASSAPALTLSGTPFAGTATTSKALVLLEDAASTNAWNTAGTYLGINAKTGFTGNLIDAQLNAVSKFLVGSDGSITDSKYGTGILHSGSGGAVTSSLIVNADVTSVDASKITTGTLAAAQMPALTGDVTTSAGAVATTIANNVVTDAKLATMATASFKGRTTAGTGNVEVLSATQATAILNVFGADAGSGGVKGLVPATVAGDSAKYLKGDGTWATVSSGGVTTMAAVGSSPNANGASIAGSTLTLQPADGTNPGVISTATQTMGSGVKTFSSNPTFSAMTTAGIVHNAVTTGALTSSLIVDADVTSVDASKITTGTLAVARGGTNLGSGTSGGILGYTASGTLASSAALAQYGLMVGGGAGATPTAITPSSSTSAVLVSGGAGANPIWTEQCGVGSRGFSTPTYSSGTYNVVAGDRCKILLIDTTSAHTLQMPTHSAGFLVTFKDKNCTANTNNVTVARDTGTPGNIDGTAASKVIATDCFSQTFADDGTDLWVIQN